MAEEKKNYKDVAGFVQFDVDTADDAGKTVRRVTIRQVGATGGLVSLTVWPSHADVPIEKGDFVAAEGAYSTNTKDTEAGPRTYHNLSVVNIVRWPGNRGTKPDTVNQTAEAAGEA